MQEYAPTLYYVQGGKNVVADALSRLPFSEEELSADENFAMTEEVLDMSSWRDFQQPLTISEIGRAQKKSKYVQSLKRQAPD